MRIAVPYDNGEVFQHFGHTEFFKIYEVENETIVSSEVIPAEGGGHDALASKLSELKVDVVICGGMGAAAHAALYENGIVICAGIEGKTDEVVSAFLKGELEDSGATCNHHDGEHQCGSNDQACGGGCGGCHGGCHSAPVIEGPNAGKFCRVHYTGTFNDGTKFDSSYDRNEPLEFVCGAGMMIRGFDEAVAVMEVGQSVDIHLMPSEAYGETNPYAILTTQIAMVPGAEDLEVGMEVYLQNEIGQPIPAKVTAKGDGMITFDANHEMAGKELNFHIELLSAE